MTSIKIRLLCWLAALLSSAASKAQLPNVYELNTGARAYNAAPVGSLDPNWEVAQGDTARATGNFVPAIVLGNCDAAWPQPKADNASWIGYDFGSGCSHVSQGCIDLYFRRSIQLPATNDCGIPIDRSFGLFMDFLADNCVYTVSVNGIVNYQFDKSGDPYKYTGIQNIVSLNLRKGWEPGTNTLLVHTKSCPTLDGFLAQAVIQYPPSQSFLGRDTIVCEGNTLVLSGPSDSTHWFDGTVMRHKTIASSGSYWATITGPDGCEITDTVAVQITLHTYVPNAFSPNDDGRNDCFAPTFSQTDFTHYALRIFDRSGTQVFLSNHPDDGWDGRSRGKACPAGVYVYVLAFQYGYCKATVYKGDLSLIR